MLLFNSDLQIAYTIAKTQAHSDIWSEQIWNTDTKCKQLNDKSKM